jgi:abequosyltransferase
MTQPPAPKLSICIPTFNRANFIGATLESVLSQVTSECEIVISDNASTDDTQRVVAEYASRFGRLRYVRHGTNRGLDGNFDSVIELARGEYCWLLPDDDLMKPGAVSTVLKALDDRDLSLIILNVEHRNADMSKVLRHRWIDFQSDRLYESNEMDRLFSELDETLWYVGNVIIKKSIWIARERKKYYGLMFLHVAVIYQKRLPGKALVIADPLVSYRVGGAHSWGAGLSELLLAKWPSLVESLAVSPSARRKVRTAEPWRSARQLLRLRGNGSYNMEEYRRWIRPRLISIREKLAPICIALLPGMLVNTLFFLSWIIRPHRGDWLIWMSRGPYNPWNWRTWGLRAKR